MYIDKLANLLSIINENRVNIDMIKISNYMYEKLKKNNREATFEKENACVLLLGIPFGVNDNLKEYDLEIKFRI